MRARIAVARWLVVLLLLYGVAPLQAAQQHSAPIKKKGLIDALGTGGLTAAELIELVNQRGVNFRMGYDEEEDLRNAGASPAVLEAIRKHYRGAPVPQADKTNAANLLKSSRALFDAHDANSALPVVNQALALDPDDADAYILRGRIYLASGQAKKAEADLNTALEIAPGSAEAQWFLATAKNPRSSGGTPGATGSDIPAAGHKGFLGFRWGTRNGQFFISGVLPSGSAARGGLLVGDQAVSANGLPMKEFEDQYMRAERLNPGETVRLQILRQGQPLELQLVVLPRPTARDEALNYYGQLIQQYPGNPEAYLYRAMVNVQLKNLNAALEDMNTFVRLDPGDLRGYEERAKIKTSLGDQAGAKADQDEVARLIQPTNSTTPAKVFPERWNLLQLNKDFRIRQIESHLYIQGIDFQVTADAEKTTDKKGNVIYKGKWRQKNANGTFSQWNMTLKTVTPERIEGTVLTLIFTGDPVTFIPEK